MYLVLSVFTSSPISKATDLATSNLHSCDKKETMSSDAHENDSAAKEAQMLHCE
jgi:hypothetical protein